MKAKRPRAALQLAAILLLLSILNFQLSTFAQGTAFTYQGELNDGANPANGSYDLRFTVFPSAGVGSAVAGPLTNTATAISNGLFTVTLDFGAGIFNGQNRWLEIAARTNGSGGFTTLSPRQWVTPAPYAIAATGLLGPLTGSLLQGTYPGVLTLNNAANQLAGSFTGNGAGVTNLNASQLLSGTVPDARLSANVALRAGGNSFTGNQSLSGGNLSLGDANASIIFPAVAGASSPMITMFAGGTGNSNRMVLAHSPTYANWGLQYQDVNDQFDFLAGGSPVMTVALGNHNVGVGTLSPDRPLAVQANGGSELISLKDNTGTTRWHLNLQSGSLNFAQSAVADARLLLSTNGNVGIGTNAPSVKLDVNGTIRAGGGVLFADGSMQTSAATGATSSLVTSGLPLGSTFTVTFNGTAAELISYEELHPVTTDISSGLVYLPIGTALASTNGVIIRRNRSADTNWTQWADFSRAANYPLAMTLAMPGGSSVTWTGTTHIRRYTLTNDNSGIVEQLALAPAGILSRSRTGSPAVTAPSTPLVGVQLWLTNNLQPGIAILSGPEFAYAYTSDGTPTGGRSYDDLKLRANPVSSQILYQTMTLNSALQSLAVRQSGTVVVSANTAAVSSYKLTLADDGLPIEEYLVHFSAP